jgi:hypothetical protein
MIGRSFSSIQRVLPTLSLSMNFVLNPDWSLTSAPASAQIEESVTGYVMESFTGVVVTAKAGYAPQNNDDTARTAAAAVAEIFLSHLIFINALLFTVT